MKSHTSSNRSSFHQIVGGALDDRSVSNAKEGSPSVYMKLSPIGSLPLFKGQSLAPNALNLGYEKGRSEKVMNK